MPKPRLPWGDFDVQSEVARGSMGVVYRARDRKRGREIALKLLLSDSNQDDEGHERFKREARSLARLSHPGIVKVYDYGVHKGIPYLTMEFVPGKTLQSLIETHALRLLPGVDVLFKVARAIDHAHSRGVVHRDLKPANVLIGADNRPRISDFGLAKLEDGRITLTHDGDIVGTPLYMSPEQIQGALAQVGPSSDVWALGVMLYRILTGALPFNGTTVEEVSREVVNRSPVAPRTHVPDVPEDLERVCLTALNKSPRQRYQSAGEFARDLAAYLQGRPVLAGRVTAGMHVRRGYRSLRLYAPTFLPGLVCVLALGLLAGWLAFPAPPGGAAPSVTLHTSQLDGAEEAWRNGAYDVLDDLLRQIRGAGPSDDAGVVARLAALEARRSESLPELEAALRRLGRVDDALALAEVAAADADLKRLVVAADALPASHPRQAWLAWLLDTGQAPPEAARVLGDPMASVDAADVPALERAAAAIESGSFRVASATLAPLLAKGDLRARVLEARLLLQRGLPRSAQARLASLPLASLPPSLAHEARVLAALIELGPDLVERLEDLARSAPQRLGRLGAERWAALAGAAVVPQQCPAGPPTVRLAWLRAAVAARTTSLEDLLVAASDASDPTSLEFNAGDYPDADALGLPSTLHDPLLRAKVVLLRLGRIEPGLYSIPVLRNGFPGRPDVDGARGPLGNYLEARIGPSTDHDFKVEFAKEATPGCDPWPLRIAEGSLAAYAYTRREDPELAESHLKRASRAIKLALAMNPFHRHARLVSAYVNVCRSAGSFVKTARERLRTDVQVAELLWSHDPSVAGWSKVRRDLFQLPAREPSVQPENWIELARQASAGSFDTMDVGPPGALAYTLAVDLVLTNLAGNKGLSPALEAYPARLADAAAYEASAPDQRTRWLAVSVALEPLRLDEVLQAPPREALPLVEGEKLGPVDRVAQVLRWVTLAAQGQPGPEGWVSQARTDLDYARRRWPALGIEALSSLVELAATESGVAAWPELVVEPWPGTIGGAIAGGRNPGGALGKALEALAGSAPE